MESDPEVWIKYPAVLLTGFLVTFLLTPLWSRLAPLLGFVDQPDARRLHVTPTPTAGGLALFAGFHVACALIFLFPWKPFAGQVSHLWWWRLLSVTSCVVAVGVLDDRLRLKPLTKLAGQIVAALLAYALGVRMGNAFGVDLPLWLDVVGTVVWFLIFINAFNLIDGMDGLATGLAIVASLGVGASLLFRHQPGDVLVYLGLVGACLGFLRYNFNPASVFLGDTGSMFLGCILAGLALTTSSKGTAAASLGVPILAVGVPVLDAGLAIWRRSVRSYLAAGTVNGFAAGVATADKEHLHHRLLRRGFSQRSVAVMLYVFGLGMSAVGVLTAVQHEYTLGVILVAFLVGTYVIIRHLAWIELWDSGSAVLKGLRRPNLENRALFVYPVVDVLSMGLALAGTIMLVGLHGHFGTVKEAWAFYAPCALGVPMILLVATRSYSRVWSLARVSEYALTGGAVAVGILFGVGLMLVFDPHLPRFQVIGGLLYLGFALPLVVGARALVRMVQDTMSWMSRFGSRSAHAKRVLLVGAGPECTIYLKERSLLDDDPGRIVVVGLIDDDPVLRGRWVHGYRVLGGVDRIPEVLNTIKVDRIVIIGNRPDPYVMRVVQAATTVPGVTVRQWTTSLRVLL